MLIEKDSKLVIIGDSITDAGRNYNAGEGWQDAFGYGYVNLLNGLLTSSYPERNIRVVNRGISGDTIRHLKGRWQKDVIDLKPDWLSIMIGVNDAWRYFDTPLITENRVSEEEYRYTYEEIVTSVKPMLKGLIIVSPHMIESNKNDLMRAKVDRFAAIAKETADKFGAIYVDTQRKFDEFCQVHYSAALSLDRVHPNTAGHMIITKEILRALEFNWTK